MGINLPTKYPKKISIIIMSKEDLIYAIESRLDTIEGLVDEIEETQVNVEAFRNALGKVWNEWEKLSE